MGDEVGGTVTIDRRFCGPPSSGNGGYSAGLVATALTDGPAEVTLFGPPPIDRPLQIERDGERARLLDGDTAVAEARRVDAVPDAIAPISLDAALAAQAAFDLKRYVDEHPFPGCFACGPGRSAGDGLRIFPALHGDPAEHVVVWPWTPDESSGGADGSIEVLHLWAALDCSSAGPWISYDPGDARKPMVLGRIGAAIHRRPAPLQPLVVGAWRTGHDGRKYRSGSALWSADGELLATGWATWIELTDEQAAAFAV